MENEDSGKGWEEPGNTDLTSLWVKLCVSLGVLSTKAHSTVCFYCTLITLWSGQANTSFGIKMERWPTQGRKSWALERRFQMCHTVSEKVGISLHIKYACVYFTCFYCITFITIAFNVQKSPEEQTIVTLFSRRENKLSKMWSHIFHMLQSKEAREDLSSVLFMPNAFPSPDRRYQHTGDIK